MLIVRLLFYFFVHPITKNDFWLYRLTPACVFSVYFISHSRWWKQNHLTTTIFFLSLSLYRKRIRNAWNLRDIISINATILYLVIWKFCNFQLQKPQKRCSCSFSFFLLILVARCVCACVRFFFFVFCFFDEWLCRLNIFSFHPNRNGLLFCQTHKAIE